MTSCLYTATQNNRLSQSANNPFRDEPERQTLWSLLPILAISAINLISVPLFYRFLGAQMYALWFYVLTFTGAFGFMDLGLGVAVGRYIGVALGRKDLRLFANTGARETNRASVAGRNGAGLCAPSV